MVQEEKPEPMTLAYARMAAHGLVLVGYPYYEYDVEGRGGVVEKLRHDRFHANERQYDRQQRRCRKRHRYV